MKLSGLVLAMVMLVLLIAVLLGTQGMQELAAVKLNAVMLDRDTAVELAQEVVTQRNYANNKLDATTAKADALEKKVAEDQGVIAGLEDDLLQERQKTAGLQVKVDHLTTENAALTADYQTLQASYQVLQDNYGRALVLLNNRQLPEQAVQSPVTNEQSLCLPVNKDQLPNQLGMGLAVLVGLLVLGSGGMVVYLSDPNRKILVRMSRAELKEFARYQRERGNIAG